jgi:hypothetical protein
VELAAALARLKHELPEGKVMLMSIRLLVASLALAAPVVYGADTTQEHVHNMSHGVMPFDMSKTTHIFAMTEKGGVQKVVANDPAAADQVAMIQQHLHHEAESFQKGDYTDPAKLHGMGMPGLSDLQAGAAKVTVTYAELPAGAQITFETADLHLLTAIHRWFGAQLSEHGADARTE